MAKKKKGSRKKATAFNPEQDTGIDYPVYSTVATGDVNDRYSLYPSKGLDPRRLARILLEADQGDVYAQMELFEEMEEKDAHLFSQMQTRKLAVTGLEWEVQPFSEEERDIAIADFVKQQLLNIENFDNVLIDLMDAIGKGTSIMEILWDVEGGSNVIEDIAYVHPKKLMWSFQEEKLLLCTKEYPEGIEMPENKFVIHNYKAKSGHPSRSGIMRVISWMYMFKNYTVKDWVAFCEVYGMPLRLGKYDQSASDRDKKELMNAIVRLGSDAAGIIPDTTMIEFIESNKTTSVDTYERLARYCDEQISKAVLGQTLTSDSGGGSYAQSKTHNEVRHDLTVADSKALAVTIRRDIIRPLVEFNFGTDSDLPFFDFDVGEEEDQKEKVDILKTLVCDIGLQVPASYAYQAFNIPKPDTDEKTLKPHTAMQVEPQDPIKEPLKKVSLTSKEEFAPEQQQLEYMIKQCCDNMGQIFRKMGETFRKELESYDGTLESFREEFSREDKLKEMYAKLDDPELQDLLHQSLYLSGLIGRTQK